MSLALSADDLRKIANMLDRLTGVSIGSDSVGHAIITAGEARQELRVRMSVAGGPVKVTYKWHIEAP